MRLTYCEPIRSFIAKNIIKDVIDRSVGYELFCLFEDIVLADTVILERWSSKNILPFSHEKFYLVEELVATGHCSHEGKRLSQYIYTDGNIIIKRYTYRKTNEASSDTTIGYCFDVINSKYLHYIKNIDETESNKIKDKVEKYKSELGEWINYSKIDNWSIK